MNTGDMLKCCVISDEIVRQYEDLCRKKSFGGFRAGLCAFQ